MDKKLPKYLLEKYQLTGTVTFTVLFAVVFLNIYIPFSDTAWFALGNSANFLITAGFIAISMLILIASRVLMYKTRKMFDMRYWQYILWCITEVVLICTFYTFVTVDIIRPVEPHYLRIFAKALFYGVISLIVPYILSGMYFAIIDKNNTIRLMKCQGPSDTGENPGNSDSQITFFDSNGALKLSVQVSNLYYIESDDNYIKVWYTDGKGLLKRYMLRCRLKTVEASFNNTSLVRCSRKCIVNIDKVKILSKESSGYSLDLDNEEIPAIPVTKTYEENILKCFSGKVRN